jgi:PTS system galactitol-specific IIC component
MIETSIGVGALMLLMPRMVKILMEGLIPLSEAAKAFMQKRFKGRDFYIGLDSAITLANPTTIVVGILIIPITLLIALLPFNTTLPAGDLSAGAYYVCFFSIIHKNNFLRTLISGTILMVAVYWLMSIFAPTINEMAIAANYVQQGGSMGISAGINVAAGSLLLFIKWIGGNIGGIVMLAVAVLYYFLCNLYYKKHANDVI